MPLQHIYKGFDMSQRLITFGSVFVALLSLSLWAVDMKGGHTPSGHAQTEHTSTKHTTGMSHSPEMTENGTLAEGGQATFAALVEIVALLENNDQTDWDRVDLDSTHAHLIDMHHLILNTTATVSKIDDLTIRFDIRGNEESISSVHRMVPAHAQFIEQSRGWAIVAELEDEGASLTIDVAETSSLKKLKALGFYGFMSLDSHHQAHHLQMALGESHH